MSVSDADIAFATELFAPLGSITRRKMMGGLCLYADGGLFGILDREGQIYIRAKGRLADDLADDGARQFGRMGYWSLPDAALDDPETACDWARRSLSEAEE
ncbi:MAG: TfoX/Sxy family protein [Silicimonas sp.]|nr:TfoX/Sxy family protein [Silicimonas sp.]